MPYIDMEHRAILDRAIQEARTPFALGKEIADAGELNYIVTKVIRGYLVERGVNYQTMNDIVGALESCKAEFQRRVVAPYEDIKEKENGDVY